GAPADAPGEIYLIESGPGDPDLLTFRALRLMQQADAVVRTPSVPTAIADLCRRDADMLDTYPLCAGAAPGCAGQLADLARQGKRVALLIDRKSTRLNSSHVKISYAVFCLKKKKT